jgi:FkbH-like protein
VSEAGEALARWRSHQRAPAGQPVRVGLCATFTVEALVPFAGAWLVERGFAPSFAVAPYDQVAQVCASPREYFGDCDAVAVLWRLEDVLRDQLARALGEPAVAHEALDRLADSVRRLRASFAGTVIVSTPPLPQGLPTPRTLDGWHHQMALDWRARLEPIPRVAVVDVDALQRQVGAEPSYDARRWYLYRQPYSDQLLLALGAALGRVVRASRRAAKKCLVLDCDNTLWGGVLGEDGLERLELGDEFPGSAFRDFQRLLLEWRSRGVLLALLSRNDEADVWEVFARHDGMVLRREHVSAWRIDWNRKADNLPLIAADLRLSIDSLVFVDDSRFEIEQMRQSFPEVECLLVPEDPAELVGRFRALDCFDSLAVTDEDAGRAEMLRAEERRRELSARVSPEAFLASLELEVELFDAGEAHLARVAQLVNKTNQFNLTTRRRTADELSALAGHRLLGARVRDRFGEYGLTAVMIVETQPRSWRLDTFLVSCRVLGRGVETALLHGVCAEARRAGAVELTAVFVPTAKNAVAADFLPRHGFSRRDDGSWALSLEPLPPAPAHVRIVQ